MFKCEKCNCSTCHPLTKKCTYCSIMEHSKFIRLLSSGENDPNHKEWNPFLEAIRNRTTNWKVMTKPVKECGHPGVVDTARRCVFCVGVKPDTREYVIANYRKKVEQHRTQMEYYEALIAGIEAGFIQPEIHNIGSPRQRAIASGERWYQSEKPCTHCGVVGLKYVANGRCKSCKQ